MVTEILVPQFLSNGNKLKFKNVIPAVRLFSDSPFSTDN